VWQTTLTSIRRFCAVIAFTKVVGIFDPSSTGYLTRYGASLGGSLCNTSKRYVWLVRLTSHKSETTQKTQIT
jgi:hypothetical protein